MGVDDEYKMVSVQDDAHDHLLENSPPITRAAYKKRSLFASVAVGALVGAAVMFLFSILFAPSGFSVAKPGETKAPEAALADTAPVTVTASASTVTVTATATPLGFANASEKEAALDAEVDAAHKVIEPGVIMDCGNTVEDARAKGCVFDVMMQDWMPAPCYDEALSERYLANGNWTWWADAEATRELSLEEMRKGEHPVIFVVQDYHKSHCIYAWEKAVRAMRNNWPMIEELISYDHVMHCRHSTLSKHSEEVKGVRAPTAWVRCALYRDWQGHFPGNSVSSID